MPVHYPFPNAPPYVPLFSSFYHPGDFDKYGTKILQLSVQRTVPSAQSQPCNLALNTLSTKQPEAFSTRSGNQLQLLCQSVLSGSVD